MGSADQNATLIKEGAANTHLTHLEELVLTQGPQGYEMARAFLLELLQTLKGNTDSRIQTSVKWDGAPAIFAGVNPENGKFFVGTKSVFNATPKINYTPQDIIKNHSKAKKDDDENYERDEEGNVNHGGLVDKLLRALEALPKLGIKKILQGDFMFDDTMLDVTNINGEPHYRFKPNTLIYAVPVNSKLGQKIGQSKFGIVFHTTYDSLDSGASFGADVSKLNRVPGVWFDDAFFTDDTGTVTLTEDEEQKIISLIKEADVVNKKIDYNDLPMAMLNIYINSEIKGGQFLDNPESSFEGFVNWYMSRSDAAISKLKTNKGKERKRGQQQQTLQTFESNKEDILNLFQVSRLLFEAKNIFIEKYNNAVYNTKHFVDDGSGDLVATNPEGYVAVDRAGNGVKFVDRLEFSRANFMVDKSAKFVQENLSIQISKDRQVTKTISEWIAEIKNANHTYQKPPQLVYKDILAGTPIVEIVSQENAEKTIYNAVITYVNNLREDVEDEDEDPVVDVEFEDEPVENTSPQTIAIVPGAYKPPHKGHLDMVVKYLTGEGISVPKADKVIVIISKPTLKGRYLPDGTEVGVAESEKLWNQLIGGMPGVEVIPSKTHASPINAGYEMVGADTKIPAGTNIILGASQKGDDWKRWSGAEKYVSKSLNLIDPESSAVPPKEHDDGYIETILKDENSNLYKGLPSVKSGKNPNEYHASDFRYMIGEASANPVAKKLLESFIGEGNVNSLLVTFGLSSELDEMSSGGAAGGYGAPFPGKVRRKKTKKQQENIDTSLIDDVMRLIMERGISQ